MWFRFGQVCVLPLLYDARHAVSHFIEIGQYLTHFTAVVMNAVRWLPNPSCCLPTARDSHGTPRRLRYG